MKAQRQMPPPARCVAGVQHPHIGGFDVAGEIARCRRAGRATSDLLAKTTDATPGPARASATDSHIPPETGRSGPAARRAKGRSRVFDALCPANYLSAISVQRLQLHDGGAVVVAEPHRDGHRLVVDPDVADVG